MAIKRQQIVDKVIQRMKTILITNSYYTNIGRKVFDWKSVPFEQNDLPGVDVRDPMQSMVRQVSQGDHFYHDYFLEVEIVQKYPGSTARTEVRKGLTDVKKAIKTDLTWGGLAINTSLADGDNETIEIEQAEVTIINAVTRINIHYRTEAWLET